MPLVRRDVHHSALDILLNASIQNSSNNIPSSDNLRYNFVRPILSLYSAGAAIEWFFLKAYPGH